MSNAIGLHGHILIIIIIIETNTMNTERHTQAFHAALRGQLVYHDETNANDHVHVATTENKASLGIPERILTLINDCLRLR
jgi:hypothetical protein